MKTEVGISTPARRPEMCALIFSIKSLLWLILLFFTGNAEALATEKGKNNAENLITLVDPEALHNREGANIVVSSPQNSSYLRSLSNPDCDEIYVVVEEMPELVGGIEALQKKLRYPEISRSNGVEGRVIVQFTVDTAGKVWDPIVLRGIDNYADKEVQRLVQTADFNPGLHACNIRFPLFSVCPLHRQQ